MHEEWKMASAGGPPAHPAWPTTMRDEDRSGRATIATASDSPHVWEETLLARLAEARDRLCRERSEAPALCAELLALPPEQQVERAAADSRFQTWGVCEELLWRSAALEEADAAANTAANTAGHLATLTLAAAGRLGDEHGAPLVRDLEARAWACLGTARLRTGDLAGAEEALREGAFRLADGTGDLLVDARLLEFEAAVREAEGGLRAAASLLRQAEARYREIGETTFAARVQGSRERLLREMAK